MRSEGSKAGSKAAAGWTACLGGGPRVQKETHDGPEHVEGGGRVVEDAGMQRLRKALLHGAHQCHGGGQVSVVPREVRQVEHEGRLCWNSNEHRPRRAAQTLAVHVRVAPPALRGGGMSAEHNRLSHGCVQQQQHDAANLTSDDGCSFVESK